MISLRGVISDKIKIVNNLVILKVLILNEDAIYVIFFNELNNRSSILSEFSNLYDSKIELDQNHHIIY